MKRLFVSVVLCTASFFALGLFSYDVGNYLKRIDSVVFSIPVWKIGDLAGNRMSSGRLGLVYWIGDNVEKDYKKAKPYLEKGLEGGGGSQALVLCSGNNRL